MSRCAATVGVVAACAAVAFGAVTTMRRRCTFATVRGRSMSPTFADGERVLAVRRRRYRVGDVVVFRTPGARMFDGDPAWRIKRVVAVAGDPNPWPAAAAPSRVPVDHLAVAGDGVRSEDSRHLGFVPIADVAGMVVPARPSRGVHSLDRPVGCHPLLREVLAGSRPRVWCRRRSPRWPPPTSRRIQVECASPRP